MEKNRVKTEDNIEQSTDDDPLSGDELELKDKIIKYLESADASKENFEEIVKG